MESDTCLRYPDHHDDLSALNQKNEHSACSWICISQSQLIPFVLGAENYLLIDLCTKLQNKAI